MTNLSELIKVEVTFEELFELLEFNKNGYYDAQYYNTGDIFVETPTGYTEILGGCVKNNLNMLEITIEDGSVYNVAEEHIFSCKGEEVFAKDAITIDTRNGSKKIVSKTTINESIGYDINIKSPHWYYTINDVIHHNSLMMTDIISGVIKKNKNVLLISLEMADKEIMKRVHANAMDLPINSLIDLSRTEGELAKIRKGSDREPPREIVTKEQVITAYNKMKMDGNTGKLFIKDYPSGSFSGLMLEQLIESYKIEKNIVFDIVFVDYVGIMKSDRVSPNAGLYSYIKSIAEEVRAVAQKMLIPIISASQLNRGAIGNTDADNSAVSDSIGSVMTADFMLFLLQDEEMKERGEMILKCTKNRFNGRTDTWMMSVDYTRMRFEDMLVQGETTLESISDILMPTTDSLSDDFGIVTAKKQADAEAFAKNEVQAIISEDITKIKAADKKLEKDPFASDLEDIFKELNI